MRLMSITSIHHSTLATLNVRYYVYVIFTPLPKKVFVSLKKLNIGVPGWLSRSGVRLWISAWVMISGLWDQVPCWAGVGLCAGHGTCLRLSLPLPPAASLKKQKNKPNIINPLAPITSLLEIRGIKEQETPWRSNQLNTQCGSNIVWIILQEKFSNK